MQELEINQVARLSGLAASALRHYEEKGLIQSVGRNGLRRVFTADVLERLALIALGQSAGFTLAEIRGLLSRAGPLRVDRDRLARKADELELTIARMTRMRDGLRHAAQCSAPSHLECPKFRRLMGLAVADTRRGRRRQRQRQRKSRA